MNRLNKKAGLLLTLLLTITMVMGVSVLSVYAGGDELEYSYPTVYVADANSPDGFAVVPTDGTPILNGTVYFNGPALVLDNFKYEGDGLVSYPSVDTNNTRGAIWIKGTCNVFLKGNNSIVITSNDDKAQNAAGGIFCFADSKGKADLTILGEMYAEERKLNISVDSTSPNEKATGIYSDGDIFIENCTLNASSADSDGAMDCSGIEAGQNISIAKAIVNAGSGKACSIAGSTSYALNAGGDVTIFDWRTTSATAEAGTAHNVAAIHCNSFEVDNPRLITAIAGECYEGGTSYGLRSNAFKVDVDVLENNDVEYTYTFKSEAEDGIATSMYPNPTGNLGYYMDIDDNFSGPSDTTQRINMSKALINTGAKSLIISDVNNAKKISDMNFKGINAAYEDPDGNPVVPLFKVFDGDKELSEGTDYVVTYAGTTVKETDTGSVTVYGLGKYYGEMTAQYEVYAKADISNCIFTPGTSTFTYTGSEMSPDHAFVDSTYKLVPGEDFTYTFYEDSDRTIPVSPVDAGTYYVNAVGINAYKGTIVIDTPLIINKAAATLTLSKKSFTYNGKTQKPTATSNSDGAITVTSGKKPGKYKVSVAESINYKAGSTTYSIVVKPTSIKKLSRAKKAFKVTATKQSSTYITGYQVRYSLKSNMSKAKTKTIGTKTSAVTKTIKKLKAKKYYYVQVRTYKTISGKKYYSAWSSTKKVKTK